MTIAFTHSEAVRAAFPGLACHVVQVSGITADAAVVSVVRPYLDRARTHLSQGSESELPEIQAWRRAFSVMGLKPTQYRCASEALLRRLRTEGALPSLHPLVDVCNALSVAFAIPVAVFDIARISGKLVVRHAHGDERYETFAGATEFPQRGEVIFADGAGLAHARRWTNRQSAASAVGSATSETLIVAEALHSEAAIDVAPLASALCETIRAVWPNAAVASRSAT